MTQQLELTDPIRIFSSRGIRWCLALSMQAVQAHPLIASPHENDLWTSLSGRAGMALNSTHLDLSVNQ